MVIYLGCWLPNTSIDLPEAYCGAGRSWPLFGLSPDGVYRAADVTTAAGVLLPHRFTLTLAGTLISVALSVGLPRLAVSQHRALWSTDFPHPNQSRGATIQPA